MVKTGFVSLSLSGVTVVVVLCVVCQLWLLQLLIERFCPMPAEKAMPHTKKKIEVHMWQAVTSFSHVENML